MANNLFITGQKGSGKTTLIKEAIAYFNLTVLGYQTILSSIIDTQKTFKMVDLKSGKSVEISKFENGKISGISESFSNFGRQCVLSSIKGEKDAIILDELGRFEKDNILFLDAINQALNSDCLVIAVLKKEPIQYIDEIKNKYSSLIIDLDEISYFEARKKLFQWLKIHKEKEKF